MSTKFINDQWRLPNEENKTKVSNYSMEFDGSSKINCGTANTYNEFTLSAWIKKDSTAPNYAGIFGTRNSTAVQFPYLLSLDAGGYVRLIAGGTTKVLSNNPISNDTWYHVVGLGDGANLKLYINGQLQTATATYTTQSASNYLMIGGQFNTDSTFLWVGQIDAVSIYNYALSSSQVTTLYGSSSTGIGNPMAISGGGKPVAYYNLGDESAFNSSSYLIPNSSLKDYVFSFDGSNDYIEVPNSSDFDFGTGDFTISSWVNTTGTTTQHRTVVSKQNPGISGQWTLQVLTDGRVNFYGNNGGIDVLSTTTINDGNWHNIVIQRTGNIFNLYIDKVLADQLTASNQNITNTQVLRIGRRLATYNGYFDGQMSNVQIFNTSLPATGSNSVETIYNNGSPLTSMTGFSSLVSWYKLDASDTFDGTNWTIEDHAGSNDGTSSGMTQSALQQSDLSFKTSYSPFALDFDGANDYIDLGNLTGVETNQFSISMWAKVTAINRILFNSGLVHPNGILIQYVGTYFFMSIGGGGGVASNAITLNTSKWYNILLSVNGTTLKFYIDGSQLGSDLTIGSGRTGIGSGAVLARYKYSTSHYVKGSISNVSIWNTSLTSSQVSELYNEGVPSNLNNHSAYSNLVNWWQLGSNSSFNTNWTVLDEKGSNNGTSVNMTEADIVDGVNTYANGVSSGMSDNIVGSAPFSDANSLSYNMDVLDRSTDVPN